MTPRSILIAGSFAQCALAVLAIGATVVGVIAAVGCAVEAVVDAVASERED